MNSRELVAGLRKTAEILRKEEVKLEQQKTIKCAQILTATRGLIQLNKNLGGAQ
jgi:hypothetical protein